MFSGIIQEKVKPVAVKKGSSFSYVFPTPLSWDLGVGESVNIDGICSTVHSLDKITFSVYYMPETIRRTTLSQLPDTHEFNLERSLRLDSIIGGHLVSGHVDTTAEVKKIVEEEDSKTLLFALPRAFTKYIIYKGSVAVNGVSLTIVSVTDTTFSVSLIPHTLTHTNLGALQKGDSVNIEIDMVAKYIEKLLPR